MNKGIVIWIAGLVMLGAVFGGMYFSEQQVERREANNPQVQLAGDVAAKLSNGANPNTLFSTSDVNANRSLTPFVVVYDKTGKPIAGDGKLDGKLPTVPVGILTESNGLDYNFVTWQPEGDLRFAAVTMEAGNYYVLSARSLTEVEKLESKTLQFAMMAWYFSAIVWTIVVTTAAFILEKDAFTKRWFSNRRLFGKGWRPVAWEGWLIALVIPAAILFNLMRLTLLARHPERNGVEFLIETIVIVILAVGIVSIVRRRG